MKELPTYTPDFEEYIRMKEAGSDGFPYERVSSQKQRTTRERVRDYLLCRPYADYKQLSYVLKISVSTVKYHINRLHKDGVIVCTWDTTVGRCWNVIQK